MKLWLVVAVVLLATSSLLPIFAQKQQGNNKDTAVSTCENELGQCTDNKDTYKCMSLLAKLDCPEGKQCCKTFLKDYDAAGLPLKMGTICNPDPKCNNVGGNCIPLGETCEGKSERKLCKSKKCTCCYDRQSENCMDLLKNGVKTSGIHKIFPKGFPQGVEVVCDQTTDGGGWTVVLQRKKNDPQVDFAKTFNEYATGFGDPETEYWIGNRVLHSMTRERYFTLWVQATNLDGEEKNGYWGLFMVGTLYDWYPLRVEDYLKKSTLGDALYRPEDLNDSANNQMFSTDDRDNDNLDDDRSCSKSWGKGGWWYNACYGANPTAPFGDQKWEGDKANWQYWDSSTRRSASWLSQIQFKIRPSQC